MTADSDSTIPVATPQADTFDCDSEPIHVPGAIQPHGALVALLVDDGIVTHASANLEVHLGVAPAAALGRPVSFLFGDTTGRSILDACHGPAPTIPAEARDGSPLQLNAFRSGDYLCVDIEPVLDAPGQESLIGMAQSVVEPMREAADRIELCELAVSGLKRILGYDRVMAYRFAADGHGEVIAEVRAARLEPYLGLRYPASDIPPQARLLYSRKRVGGVVDSRYVPVPLVVRTRAHPPLDLTMSGLRSVSPVHCEYMRNMGTAASLTIGLSEREGLWGMLVCHHATPRTTGPGHRAVADIVGADGVASPADARGRGDQRPAARAGCRPAFADPQVVRPAAVARGDRRGRIRDPRRGRCVGRRGQVRRRVRRARLGAATGIGSTGVGAARVPCRGRVHGARRPRASVSGARRL